MAKKKSVFGQLTLTGDVALDWLKDGSRIRPELIQFGPIESFSEYNVPEWAKERNSEIVVITSQGFQNPLLITQKGVMRQLERMCVEFEEKGIKVLVEDGRAICDFEGKADFDFLFDRNAKLGQFAPYEMKVK